MELMTPQELQIWAAYYQIEQEQIEKVKRRAHKH